MSAKITLENVTTDELLSWMHEEIPIYEDQYLSWKKRELNKPLKKIEPKSTISGSDFKAYWTCPRILYGNVHHPVVRTVAINRGYFYAILKHELIQSRLEERGWTSEVFLENPLEDYPLLGTGHVDCLSPSEQFFLEIKHNPPTLADELQAGWYQFLHHKHPTICLLYRERFDIIPDHSRLIRKYLPRVAGTILNDLMPPLRPGFPYCLGTCDYAPIFCGRAKTIRMKDEVPPEWNEWLTRIGAIKKRELSGPRINDIEIQKRGISTA